MNGKDKITKMNNMEIKVGDKVRVSYDEARKYQKAWRYILETCIFKVKNIENDTAFITNGREDIAISTKYLIKIGTEPTATTIKVGDKVEELVSRKSGRVLRIEGDFVVVGIPYDKEKHYWHIDSVELVEPTEQTEAEKTDSDVPFSIFRDDLLSNPQIVNLHNGMHYWQCYEANLAKEVALKVANKKMDNHPEEIGAYAVSVAKAVVEGLKRK